jgi:hypothetical protein
MNYSINTQIKTSEGLRNIAEFRRDVIITTDMIPRLYSECKLPLTPIEDITDEDAIELCRLYYPLAFQGKCPPSKWEVKRDMILDCHYRSIGCNGNGNSFNIDLTNICMERYDEGELCESGYMLPATDFLRSRSYHLPYRNINLFQAGIAIKPPTI